ncbi:MAG: RidA family protein [Planctomycetaceae bacterium]|nr:RidA family protein [Planctomycetaceae bacterium]
MRITRLGNSERWSDVVIFNQTARWVEVASNQQAPVKDQICQILQQIDETLDQIGSTRKEILEVTVFLADLTDVPTLNEQWDAWVPPSNAPIRACVQAGLQGNCRIEMIIHAAAASE